MEYFAIYSKKNNLIETIQKLDGDASLINKNSPLYIIKTNLTFDALLVVKDINYVLSLKSVVDDVTGE